MITSKEDLGKCELKGRQVPVQGLTPGSEERNEAAYLRTEDAHTNRVARAVADLCCE